MKKLLRELKRRNVIKAAISYVVFAWVLIQAASIFFPTFGLGDGAMKIMMIVLIAAFPIWLIFAYIFEWTPQGFKKTTEVNEESSLSKVTNKKLNGIIIAGLSLAVILLITDRIFSFTKLSQMEQSKSIAVLPFDNMSSEDDSYFTKGVTEDILTQISKIKDIRVLSNFTLKDYDSNGKTIDQIGKELDVNYVLTGSVRRANQQLRISTQLVQIKPEEQIWADNYDKSIEDVFAIQTEVAIEVGQALKITLSPEQQATLSKKPTPNTVAYNYYLKGREEYNTYSPDGMSKAIQYFEEATSLDPNFALAWAGLTDAYNLGSESYKVVPITYLDSALVTGHRALRLDKTIPETWKALGSVYYTKGNPTKAKYNFKKALEINPNHIPSLSNMAGLLWSQGNFDEALVIYQKIVARNPLDFWTYRAMGTVYAILEMDDKALEAYKKALSIAPNDFNTLLFLSQLYVLAKDTLNAREALEKFNALDPESALVNELCADIALNSSDSLSALYLQRAINCKDYNEAENYSVPLGMGYVLWEEGKRQEALVWLDESLAWAQQELKTGNKNYEIYNIIAQNYAIRGKNKEALDWLEKTIALEEELNYRNYMTDRRLKNLHKEPRFISMLAALEEVIRTQREKVLAREDKE